MVTPWSTRSVTLMMMMDTTTTMRGLGSLLNREFSVNRRASRPRPRPRV